MDDETCLDCKNAYIEDVDYSCVCNKNHNIETDEGMPCKKCEDFEPDH